MSPRTTFINELNQLKENVADMATRVEKNYETLFEAYEKKEKAAIEKIVAVDKDINRRQREIEAECLFLITRQQPIVSDLRAVTACETTQFRRINTTKFCFFCQGFRQRLFAANLGHSSILLLLCML